METLYLIFDLLVDLILRKRVFVSYSAQDQWLVRSVVRLLRMTRREVFFALDSIPLGEKWESTIQRSILRCKFVLVFWCYHSSESKEVEKEYTYGHVLGKPIVPVFLDDTRVPDLLKRYQGVDFRFFGNHTDPRNLKDSPPGPLLPIEIPKASARPAVYWNGAIRASRNRSALPIFGGLVLASLAVWRPFPALIKSELITILNLAVFGFGCLSTLYGILIHTSAKKSVGRLSESEKGLLQKLSLVVREGIIENDSSWIFNYLEKRSTRFK